MAPLRLTVLAGSVLVAGALVACGFADLTQGSGADAGAATTGEGGVDGGGVTGAGCGIESQSGATLCVATTMCPEVVVDTDSFPNCGFRIRGSTVDLVCGCGDSVCPMGIFNNCAQAADLLTTQTAQGVCVQVTEGRCQAVASSSSSSSSTSSGSTKDPRCDQECVQQCGGGAACASVCNCD